jgi:hypothetical protein
MFFMVKCGFVAELLIEYLPSSVPFGIFVDELPETGVTVQYQSVACGLPVIEHKISKLESPIFDVNVTGSTVTDGISL